MNEISIVEVKSHQEVASVQMSIEELETRLEMISCSRCCASAESSAE